MFVVIDHLQFGLRHKWQIGNPRVHHAKFSVVLTKEAANPVAKNALVLDLVQKINDGQVECVHSMPITHVCTCGLEGRSGDDARLLHRDQPCKDAVTHLLLHSRAVPPSVEPIPPLDSLFHLFLPFLPTRPVEVSRIHFRIMVLDRHRMTFGMQNLVRSLKTFQILDHTLTDSVTGCAVCRELDKYVDWLREIGFGQNPGSRNEFLGERQCVFGVPVDVEFLNPLEGMEVGPSGERISREILADILYINVTGRQRANLKGRPI